VQVTSEENETEENEYLVRLRLITHNARLVDSRKQCGLTGEDMAQAAKLSRTRLRDIENLRTQPTEDEIIRIACVLEKPIDYLFPEALASAIEAGVFSRRKLTLQTPQVISLTEAQRLRLLSASSSGQHELEEEVEKKLLKERVLDVLRMLKPREQRVLRLRFGVEGAPLTLEEVGRSPGFGVTGSRIREIQEKALRKLRHPKLSRKLEDYLD